MPVFFFSPQAPRRTAELPSASSATRRLDISCIPRGGRRWHNKRQRHDDGRAAGRGDAVQATPLTADVKQRAWDTPASRHLRPPSHTGIRQFRHIFTGCECVPWPAVHHQPRHSGQESQREKTRGCIANTGQNANEKRKTAALSLSL